MSKLLLNNRDYTFILGRSPETWSEENPYFLHWREAHTAIIKLAKRCQEYDPNGICVYYAFQPFEKYDKTDVDKIAEMLQKKAPPQESDIIPSLEDALNNYFNRRDSQKYNNGETIFLLLDKKPHNYKKLINIIVEATKKVNIRQETGTTYELALSFIQIGDDIDTTEFLKFIDDDLQTIGAQHDIVDANKWYVIERDSIQKLLEDALFD